MNVLSLFDGMSCGQVALERAGIKVNNYYASEIDKYAIKIAQKNYPKTIQLGDIKKWRSWKLSKIDLLLAGFPCQSWSLAGKQKGDNDPRGDLVHNLIDVWKDLEKKNPNLKFLFENVKMKKEFIAYINGLFGVESIEINSSLLSAQNRRRLYWSNFAITQPEDKGILLKDIIEDIPSDRPFTKRELTANEGLLHIGNAIDIKGHDIIKRVYSTGGKSPTLTANSGGNQEVKIQCLPVIMERGRGNNKGGIKALDGKTPSLTSSSWEHNNHLVIIKEKSKTVRSSGRGSCDRHEWDSLSDCHWRKLTPLECERLQTLPDNFSEGISNSQRYKCIGNGWTVDVIAHILKELK